MTGPDLQRWIADHARPLATVVPGDDGDDLAPWVASLADTRLLGVGEAVVGTRELAILAHRVVASAIAGGTRVLALGASEAATVVVDQAVGAGEDPAGAVEGMDTWRWRTGDVRTALARLAEHNAGCAPEERVRVVGVDPVAPAQAAKAVGLHLRRADPALLDEVGERLHDVVSHRPDHDPLTEDVLTVARRVRERLDREGVADELRRHARALARAAEVGVAPVAERRGVRERLVADAVADLVEGAGVGPSVVWWGQARHVRVRLDDDGPSAGARLRERFGRGYYALGLLPGQGEFRALHDRRLRRTSRTPVRHRLPAPPPGTLEETLGQAGTCLLDLRGGADRDGIPEWATTATRMRIVGDPTPVGWKRTFEAATPAEYDGLAHVERVRQAAVR